MSGISTLLEGQFPAVASIFLYYSSESTCQNSMTIVCGVNPQRPTTLVHLEMRVIIGIFLSKIF